MNPFASVLFQFPTPPTDVETSGIVAVLQLRSEAYSSGFTRGPANNEFDFVVRDLRTKFGETPMVTRVAQMFAEKLGR